MADPANTGIYEIVNLVNGKRYVGSAVSFPNRWNEHKRSLNKGDHHSVALQRAWKKYGSGEFEFRVLARCDRNELIAIEQIHLDSLSPEYNICKKAGSTLGFKHSVEQRAKISERVKGNTFALGFKHSPEARARMGAGKVGKKRPTRSEIHKKRLSESNKGHTRSLGRNVSAETRAKIAAANTGKKQPISVRVKLAKLSEGQVREIRSSRISGLSYPELAERYGVSKSAVIRVCLKLRYDWIDPEQPPIRRRGGWKRSAEANRLVGEASKKRWAERKALGEPNPKHKIPRSAEQRAAIAEAAKKAWDVRRQSGKTNRASPTEEQRENYRAAAQRAWDVRRANGNVKVANPRTEEQRANYSAAAKRRHQRARESSLNP